MSLHDIRRWAWGELRQALRLLRPPPVTRSTRRVVKALLLGVAVEQRQGEAAAGPEPLRDRGEA